MDTIYMRKRIEESRKEKKDERDERVLSIIQDYRRAFHSNDLVDSIQMRMSEVDTFLLTIQAALENDTNGDAAEKTAQLLWLLRERYDEMQLMVSALIEERAAAQIAAGKKAGKAA